jgi:ribonuclease HII
MLFTEFDEDVWQNQKKLLNFFSKENCIGTDEVGRGCLAGPVVAASVIFPNQADFFVTDSKKLSKKKREMISKIILASSPYIGIAFVHAPMIDKINILNATKLAMKNSINRCLLNMKNFIHTKNIMIFVDGNFTIPSMEGIDQVSIVQGDRRLASIGSASIIAKVCRDDYMKSMERYFPNYSFDQHKGYGTKKHFQAIQDLGITPLHRKTFCKGILRASN